MNPPLRSRLAATVVALNLSLELYLLWSEEPSTILKIATSVVLFGSALVALQAKLGRAFGGLSYVVMVLLAVVVLLGE